MYADLTVTRGASQLRRIFSVFSQKHAVAHGITTSMPRTGERDGGQQALRVRNDVPIGENIARKSRDKQEVRERQMGMDVGRVVPPARRKAQISYLDMRGSN